MQAESLLTNECPKCGLAFDIFTGCALLQCHSAACKTNFCGICLKSDFVVSEGKTLGYASHVHVAECEYIRTVRGPAPGEGFVGAFVREGDYRLANARYRHEKVTDFLNGIGDAGLRAEVTSKVKPIVDTVLAKTGRVGGADEPAAGV